MWLWIPLQRAGHAESVSIAWSRRHNVYIWLLSAVAWWFQFKCSSLIGSSRSQPNCKIIQEITNLVHIFWMYCISEYIVGSWWRHEMEHFPRYWPFVRGIHRSPVNSPHKGQWGGALMFWLICVWINGWVNNRKAGDLRRHRSHYDVIVMSDAIWCHGTWSTLNQLTHWGRVTHICVSELTIIGSDNGLSPRRRQAIIWNNAGLLLIEPLGTNVSEISIGIQTFSFKKMHLNMSSGKWPPSCLGLNVLIWRHQVIIEPMVTNHQQGLVVFTWAQFHRKLIIY